MADWRQVQARIRKAKSASDPSTQLTELYDRTRDAMVAFELATLQEKAGDSSEAVRWYTVAAERFRRAQWRTKAEEALTRLGAPIPAPLSAASIAASQPEAQASEEKSEPEEESAQTVIEEVAGDSFGNREPPAESDNAIPPLSVGAGGIGNGTAAGRKRRHRGRRGGRRRRGEKPGVTPGAATSVGVTQGNVPQIVEPSRPPTSARRGSPESRTFRPSVVRSETYSEPMPVHEEIEEEAPAPTPAAAPLWQGRARAGEPALASRISQLESQLRRLLACPLASLDEADQAPAGPGVLLLSDSDQHTHYYIESCQTLRIGIGNLMRGGRGSKEAGRLKGCMAENLGIPEARVSKYLKDHCAIRWLQLDEGAPELAHFATAVLRPVVNE